MICKNINDILTFTINETKFRHCLCNWVDMRRFVSGIKELGASVADDTTTIDKLTKHRKKEWH